MKDQCNLVWLEYLNLRDSFQAGIPDYVRERHPDLLPLYWDIYTHGSRLYWETLGTAGRAWAGGNGLEYGWDDDSRGKPFDAPPVMVSCFYHEEVKKSAKREASLIPELLEVEIVRRILEPQLAGRFVAAVEIRNPQIIAHPLPGSSRSCCKGKRSWE